MLRSGFRSPASIWRSHSSAANSSKPLRETAEFKRGSFESRIQCRRRPCWSDFRRDIKSTERHTFSVFARTSFHILIRGGSSRPSESSVSLNLRANHLCLAIWPSSNLRFVARLRPSTIRLRCAVRARRVTSCESSPVRYASPTRGCPKGSIHHKPS
jgi:hypothetical protein